jgi:hypothetical protein
MMLQQNRFVDLLATLLISCLGFFGWLQIVEEHNLQSMKIKELGDRQQEILKTNLNNFTVSIPVVSLDLRMPQYRLHGNEKSIIGARN